MSTSSPTQKNTMKAMVYGKYGQPEVLRLEEVEKPSPNDDEVMVKVHASSINDWDWGLLRGKPLVNRIPGIKSPSNLILGCDVAGVVEATGKNITKFQPGDEVYGDLSGNGFGCFAEYVCSRENALAIKPASMTFEQAAATPQASGLAMQGLFDIAQVKPGQQVLINGAGGGAGSFMVQIAKSLGAEVTGVDSTIKLEMMRSIGADHVMDYTKEDFTKTGQRYDLILDNAAHHSPFDHRRALNPNGAYAMLGGGSWRIFQGISVGSLISIFGNRKIRMVFLKSNKHLEAFKELFEAGKVVPTIDKIYPLSDLTDAFRYFGNSLQTGKIVITV